MEYQYKNHGTCSQGIRFELDGTVVRNVRFIGGCNGNTQGISKLVEGMEMDEVIKKLKGIRCGWKESSCPDQLARALEEIKAKSEG